MNFGTIKHWNDEKGYGFITPDNGGNDVFLHIKAFKKRPHRPEIGQVISYGTTSGDKGRLRACNVQYMEDKSSSTHTKKLTFTIYCAFLYVIGIAVGVYLGKLPKVSIYLYLGASFITFLAYGIDKSKAKQGGWRTQESTLHLFSIVGGWPGALLAQQKFNHKTTKESFRSEFWGTVVMNCVGFFWFTSPGALEKTIHFLDKFLK
ncbi:cold shock and DUF1294 domain-containing protein [Desulfotalea psychrophila]|uniref:Hypothetical cold-shock protein n=1 Tax=Desulfotalea psychrophila (strain LSv54 / DSM 12343) TaxID=177439 RepID=Q6ALH9_DESPS|nr:cold shock and DUF1294 domain-containing protein [Desulfotalea psychrophila]CAG36796.1 hypothetical cold-shock protein [Desulfotalea psychrophila LSv54]